MPGESCASSRAAWFIALAYIAGLFFFGIYRTQWKYAGAVDAFNIVLAIGVVSIFLFAINAFLNPRHIPLTVNVVAPALMLLAMGGIKFGPRLLASRNPFAGYDAGVKNVLIVGAGHTGQLLAREFIQNRRWQYRPIGFVDDDRRLRGVRMHSVTVLGDRFDIPDICATKARRSDRASDSVRDGAVMRDIVGICQKTRRAGAHGSRAARPRAQRSGGGGTARADGRRPAGTRAGGDRRRDVRGGDPRQVRADYRRGGIHRVGTGAAGVRFQPGMLHLVDVNETGLYDLERDLAAERRSNAHQIWLCDVADRAQVESTFEQARPDIVFHAAAYKHIPVMEEHPHAALRANVAGTLNVCPPRSEAGAAKVVFVSTDKAVNPDNVYGATKRIGELLVTALGQGRQDDVRRRALRQRDGQPGQRRAAVPAADRAWRPGAAHRSGDDAFQMAVEEAASSSSRRRHSRRRDRSTFSTWASR